jgi:hypothetical protein
MTSAERRKYLRALMGAPGSWIVASHSMPTSHMTRTHLLLHRVALRRKGWPESRMPR